MKMVMNIQHPTSNIQRPRRSRVRHLIGCWMFLFFIFARSAGGSPASFSSNTTRGRAARAPAFCAYRIIAVTLPIFCAFAAAAQPAIELPKLAPPLPELPPSFWEQYGSVVLVVVIAAVAIAIIVACLVLRPKPVAVVPPEVEARRSLEEIRSRPEDGAVLSRVSQILRRYFIAVFALPPGEYTTTEFCRVIAADEKIGPSLRAAVSDFMRACDEEKFSASEQPPLLSATDHALRLINLAEAQRVRLQQSATNPPGNP